MAMNAVHGPSTRPDRAGARRPSGAAAEAAGFSLPEVLVAGMVIVALVIASIRLVSSSLSGGQQTALRQQLEAEIASDFDRIRQEDQKLQNAVAAEMSAATNTTPSACNEPNGSLKQIVDGTLPAEGGTRGRWRRQTVASTDGVLQVTYTLQIPGSSVAETRVMEIAPLVQPDCLERSMGLR